MEAAEEEDAAEYLERTGVTAYLKDVSTLLLENEPDDPVSFVTDYFQNVVRGSDALSRSYRYVSSVPKSPEMFMENLAAAYAVLADATRHGSGVAQLRGAELSQLLRRLCQHFPEDVRAVVFAALNKKEADPVTLAEFSCAIRACLYFRDVLGALQALASRLADESGRIRGRDAQRALLRVISAVPRQGQQSQARVTPDQDVISRALEGHDYVTFDAMVRCVLQLLSHRL